MEISLEQYKENVRLQYETLKKINDILTDHDRATKDDMKKSAKSIIERAIDEFEKGIIPKEAMVFTIDFWLERYPKSQESEMDD